MREQGECETEIANYSEQIGNLRATVELLQDENERLRQDLKHCQQSYRQLAEGIGTAALVITEELTPAEQDVERLQARVAELEGIQNALHLQWTCDVGRAEGYRSTLEWIAKAIRTYDEDRRYASALRTIRHFVRDYLKDQP